MRKIEKEIGRNVTQEEVKPGQTFEVVSGKITRSVEVVGGGRGFYYNTEMTDEEIAGRLLKTEADEEPSHTHGVELVDGFRVVSHVTATLKFRGELFDNIKGILTQESDPGTTYINGTMYSAQELENQYPYQGKYYNENWKNSQYILGRSRRLYAFREGDKRIVVDERAGNKPSGGESGPARFG